MLGNMKSRYGRLGHVRAG